MEKINDVQPNSSLRMVDVIIGLLQRDRIEEALECQVIAITFALDNDMTTEEALRLPLDKMVELSPPPPPMMPYIPQVEGNWDRVFYGEAALKDEEE